jgi:steroid 5-alpha reductase family enzyme
MDIIWLALVLSVGINVVMFVPAFKFKTDKLTDISYALTFMFVSLVVYLQSSMTNGHLLVLVMVWAWALRLGGFLLYRVSVVGKDQRFDAMRTSLWKFGRFWLLQGLTVFVVLLAAIIYWKQPFARLDWWALVGGIIFAEGLLLEAVADQQKFKFKQTGQKGWIETGVWSISRHPNYLGEMMVWSGLFLFVSSSLQFNDMLIALISPLYIFLLLRFVSGIPILEKAADAKWGKQPKYQAYKHRVPLLVPRLRNK